MEKLLPDQLKALWQAVDQKQLTVDAFMSEQDRLLAAYRQTWEQALLLGRYKGLSESLLAELGSYMGCADMAEIQGQCVHAVATLKAEWHGKVNPSDRQSIEQFYDASQATIYDLMWWHTLCDDASPLAYVTALHFTRQQGCRSYLDFGTGVGSGGILFARHGLEVTLADISSTLLGFSQWRLDRRRLPAAYVDLKMSGCGAIRCSKNRKVCKRACGRGPMTERALIGQKAREFCDMLWQQGDFWNFGSSEYERVRCARLLTILAGRRYTRALEIGCGAGYFTRLLAGIADQIVAFDIAPAAIARARTLGTDLRQVEFRVANAMDYEWRADGPWDLVVCSDTIGRLLLANTMDEVEDKLLLPYGIRTYRDLFLHVGYRLEAEEIFRGTKNGVDFEILISLFVKAPAAAGGDG